MEQNKLTDRNRIAGDLEYWKRIEDKLVQRYGSKIINDRDFMKAKRDVFRHIRDKHKGRRLNLYERAEMRVLRGQHRSLLRRIYPNPVIRLIRNLLVFSGNLLNATRVFGMRAAKWLITPDRKPLTARSQLHTPQQNASLQAKVTPTNNRGVVRRMPVRTNRHVAQGHSKGVRR